MITEPEDMYIYSLCPLSVLWVLASLGTKLACLIPAAYPATVTFFNDSLCF
jgi:hypothetical protein